MSTPEPAARPLSIQLTQFSYDIDYEVTNDSDISYKADILHRILPNSDRMEILVTITYRAQNQDHPVLQATCLTIYEILNFARTENPKGGELLYAVPEPLGLQMTTEAIAHARALLAQQTGATPFHSSHVPLSTKLERDTGVEAF